MSTEFDLKHYKKPPKFENPNVEKMAKKQEQINSQKKT